MTEKCGGDAVGYGRPPRSTRFRKGESGNPSGRPRRRLTFAGALLDELATPMPGTSLGRTKLQALIGTLVDSAIAGNARAQSVLVSALARIGDADDQESPALTPDDQEILNAYVGAELQRRVSEAEASKPVKGRHDERRPDADDQNK